VVRILERADDATARWSSRQQQVSSMKAPHMVGLESSQWCTVTVLLLTCVVPAVPLEFRLRDHSGDACASGPAAMTALQLPASSSLSAPTNAGTSGAGSLALLVWLGNPALAWVCQRTPCQSRGRVHVLRHRSPP